VTGRTVRGTAPPNRRMRRALLLTILLCLLSPAAALGSGQDVVRDCADNGTIDGNHPDSDYASALSSLPTDVDEYTDCRQIISRARRDNAGGSSGGGLFGGGGFDLPGGGGATGPANAAEQEALDDALSSGNAAVTLQGDPIVPGASGIGADALRHAIPTPLLIVLILLGVAALASLLGGARARGLAAPAPLLKVVERVFPRRA